MVVMLASNNYAWVHTRYRLNLGSNLITSTFRLSKCGRIGAFKNTDRIPGRTRRKEVTFDTIKFTSLGKIFS
jgi:hypothetical protein